MEAREIARRKQENYKGKERQERETERARKWKGDEILGRERNLEERSARSRSDFV